MKAALIKTSSPSHHETLANILLNGGIVGAIWGHHLYFLACNGFDAEAVKKMNKLKGRPEDQVFASPGAVEEAEEFADIKKNKALLYAAEKSGMDPLKYLEYLYRKFPLGVELFANGKAPASVTFTTENGKTIWIAGHMADKTYSKFLEAVRTLRRGGKQVIFAGTSLNLSGENTLNVSQLDDVISDFGSRVDALAVHPKAKTLKRLKYTTSCSVVSFIGERPKLLRVGSSSVSTLRKYIPGLEVSENIKSTRR